MSQKSDLEGHKLAFADDAARHLAANDAARGTVMPRATISRTSSASTGQPQATIAHSPRSSAGTLVSALREADWLTADRVTAFSRVFLVLFSGCVAIIPWAAPTMDVGHDFAAFWTAAKLALEGRAGSSSTAWLVQVIAAAIAIAVLILVLPKRPGGAAEIALMVALTGLCVPSLGNYEVVILAIPGAWLIAPALAQGWLPYERIALAALYLTPFATVPAGANGLQLAPIAAVALAILVVRRIRHLPVLDAPAEIANH